VLSRASVVAPDSKLVSGAREAAESTALYWLGQFQVLMPAQRLYLSIFLVTGFLVRPTQLWFYFSLVLCQRVGSAKALRNLPECLAYDFRKKLLVFVSISILASRSASHWALQSEYSATSCESWPKFLQASAP
jgi:hypothetical protein